MALSKSPEIQALEANPLYALAMAMSAADHDINLDTWWTYAGCSDEGCDCFDWLCSPYLAAVGIFADGKAATNPRCAVCGHQGGDYWKGRFCPCIGPRARAVYRATAPTEGSKNDD